MESPSCPRVTTTGSAAREHPWKRPTSCGPPAPCAGPCSATPTSTAPPPTPTGYGREFQDYVTATAWGVWARGGALSHRDRSLLVMAMTAALGRMDEFRVHASSSPRTGVTDEEIDELLFQISAYCGVPAAVAARRGVKAVRAEREGA
ncbi:carboxymuconolactone decarboxylase family protein [Streptomyces sp. S1D4-11]